MDVTEVDRGIDGVKDRRGMRGIWGQGGRKEGGVWGQGEGKGRGGGRRGNGDEGKERR